MKIIYPSSPGRAPLKCIGGLALCLAVLVPFDLLILLGPTLHRNWWPGLLIWLSAGMVSGLVMRVFYHDDTDGRNLKLLFVVSAEGLIVITAYVIVAIWPIGILFLLPQAFLARAVARALFGRQEWAFGPIG